MFFEWTMGKKIFQSGFVCSGCLLAIAMLLSGIDGIEGNIFFRL
jgi:hypothetical protein